MPEETAATALWSPDTAYEATVDQAQLTDPETDNKCSCLIWGPPKSWKSSWTYQWPAPVVLNVVSEGGNAAIRTYPQIAEYLLSLWKDKRYPPPVFNRAIPRHYDIYYSGASRDVENVSRYPAKHCLKDAIEEIERNWRAWGIATVILDSVGFLQRLWMTDLTTYRYSKLTAERPPPGLASRVASGDRDQNKRWAERMQEQAGVLFEKADYGLFANYIQIIQEAINALPVNRIIIGHEKQILKEKLNAAGRPTGDLEVDRTVLAVSGQSQTFIPAGVDLIVQTEPKEVPITKGAAMGRRETRPIFWTVPDAHSLGHVGHRFAFAFPEGKLVDPEIPETPTFRAVYCRISNHIALPKQKV